MTVVLFKTHVWIPDIEMRALKIYRETKKLDFFILMHGKHEIQNKNLASRVLVFTEEDIRSIYPEGFYSMWISNHWILMWFFIKFGTKYKYFWSIEYDVLIVGDSGLIWNYDSDMDFLYVRGMSYHPNNKHFNCYVGGDLQDKDKRQGYLQLARYSHAVLTYFHQCFLNGENGQDELITYSLVKRGGFTRSNTYLGSLVKGTWTWDTKYSYVNRLVGAKLVTMLKYLPKSVWILHPVKDVVF